MNATPMGRPVYRRIGFTDEGDGQTWWLHQPLLANWPPAEDDVRFVRALATGRLDQLHGASDLDSPRPNGMTPIEIAAATKQPAGAEWLLEHGARIDLLSAWDLGWADRFRSLVRADPDIVNLRSRPFNATPLHEAIMRRDADLAAAILALGPDLGGRDDNWKSTPLGWANALDQPNVAKMIEEAARH